jgi:hypothetical protein
MDEEADMMRVRKPSGAIPPELMARVRILRATRDMTVGQRQRVPPMQMRENPEDLNYRDPHNAVQEMYWKARKKRKASLGPHLPLGMREEETQ